MSKPLNIAYFLGQFPRLTTTFIHNEIKYVKNHGHNVFIYVMDDPKQDDLDKTSDWKSLDLFYIKRQSTLFKAIAAHGYFLVTKPANYLSLLYEVLSRQLSVKVFMKYIWVARDVEKRSFDIIHAHLIEEQTILAKICSRLLDIPYTFKIHGSDIFLRRINSYKLMIRDAKRCFVVTQSVEDYLHNECHVNYHNTIVNPCGVDLDPFKKDVDVEVEQNMILCVARQFKEKGIEYLIEAIALLKKNNISVNLVLVGDGPDKDYFEQMVEDKGLMNEVQFTSSLPLDQVVRYYQKCSVFVLPSLCEGLPTVLLEAMALRKPVIGTNVGGIPEIVKNEKNGFLVPCRDARMLAEKIQLLLENPQLARQMGEEGYLIAKSYDTGHLVQTILNEWNQLIRKKIT